jgi:magnesium chelatase family protein
LTSDEVLEVTGIHSVVGGTPAKGGSASGGEGEIITNPPFRSPHHTSSYVALVGGGAWPKPGEITLAHKGVLFLDEFAEFDRRVIEALRQPLEDRLVSISRSRGSNTFPADFILIAAMNPCPCGNYGDDIKSCICTAAVIYKYQRKISGPMLDRIDIQINVPRETYGKMSGEPTGPKSVEVREIVAKTREIQTRRFISTRLHTNSEMGPKDIKKHCQLTPEAEELVKNAVVSHNLSGRGYHKILKIARTIADLADSPIIQANHIAEAIAYRIKPEGEGLGFS